MTQPDLMSVFDFSADDLAANREGNLSEMQLYVLKIRLRRSVFIGLGVMLGLAFAATLCLFLGNRQASPILTITGIGITFCSALVTGNFARGCVRLNADIRGAKAQRHHGKLERIIKPVTRRVAIYLIRVDGAEFNIGKDAFKLFKHEAVYTLYRAPYSGQLLSIDQ
jgi:hypothetical protein